MPSGKSTSRPSRQTFESKKSRMQLSDVKDIAPILSGAIGALATLLAVAVTGFLSFRLAKLNLEEQRRQRSEEKKLEKLEELFLLFDKWQINLSTIYLAHFRCYKGLLKFDQVTDLVKSPTLLSPGDAQKYKMLLEVHFPTLREGYAPVEEARKKIVPFLSDPTVSKLSVQDFENAQLAFEEASKDFKSCISSLARDRRV
jgi:hypothetical protein